MSVNWPLQGVLRVVSLPLPDKDTICFVHLWMGGFSEPLTLAKNLSVLCKQIADLVRHTHSVLYLKILMSELVLDSFLDLEWT